MTAVLFVAVPYLCLAVFIAGHAWRWRNDQFGWTTHTSQLLESRILRLGSPLFHLGALGVVGGHAVGLIVPASVTRRLGISERLYHLTAVWGGTLSGTMLGAGLALLVARRFVNGRIRRTTSAMDRVLYAGLIVMVVLGMSETVGVNLFGNGYDYRETVAVWFRDIFWLHPNTALMAHAPLVYRAHAVFGFLFLAMWPFTRLVHVWSAPLAYLWRPYVVYRARRGPVRVPVPRPAAVRDAGLAAATVDRGSKRS